jgi:hypothetical protein
VTKCTGHDSKDYPREQGKEYPIPIEDECHQGRKGAQQGTESHEAGSRKQRGGIKRKYGEEKQRFRLEPEAPREPWQTGEGEQEHR